MLGHPANFCESASSDCIPEPLTDAAQQASADKRRVVLAAAAFSFYSGGRAAMAGIACTPLAPRIASEMCFSASFVWSGIILLFF
jgi:hypothetical protein